MPRAGEVKITNGDQEAWVSEKEAAAYERHGWTRTDDGSSEEASENAAPATAKKTTSRKAN